MPSQQSFFTWHNLTEPHDKYVERLTSSKLEESVLSFICPSDALGRPSNQFFPSVCL